MLQECIESTKGWSGLVLRFRHKDGSYRWLQSNGVPVLDERGRVRGFQGSDRDITKRRQLEDQLRQSQKMEAVGRLAGGIAHDFNNLLDRDHRLQRDAPRTSLEPAPHGAQVGEIEKAAQRAAALTRQLLAFSRKQVLAPKVLDLNAVVDRPRPDAATAARRERRTPQHRTGLRPARSRSIPGQTGAGHDEPGRQRARRHAGRRPS